MRAVTGRVRLAASLLGYGMIAAVMAWSFTNRGLVAPDVLIWDRTGDWVREGLSPYSRAYDWHGLFVYAPPWALLFATMSWLPLLAQAALVFAAEVAALRYVAGSWLRVGYLGLIPITGGELVNGSFNLVLAAGIAMAMRGDGRLATFGAMAKFSPILAVRDIRGTATVCALALLVTLPVLAWWPEWISTLVWMDGAYQVGYPIPFVPRLVVAIALIVLVRKPWARGLAAAIAIPAIYSYSIVLLYPLVRSQRLPNDPGLPVGDGPIVAEYLPRVKLEARARLLARLHLKQLRVDVPAVDGVVGASRVVPSDAVPRHR